MQKASYITQKKIILRRWQGSSNPVIEPIDRAIKKVRSDPSLVSIADTNNGMIHDAFTVTEDLLWRMLKMKPSFVVRKKQFQIDHTFSVSLKSIYNRT